MRQAAWFVLALLAAAGGARADDARGARVPLLPAYQQECAGCHLAYPPGLLPAASWARLMDGLPRHFGTDASLDAAVARPIAAWLAQHAGTDRKLRRDSAPPPDDRITRAGWFVREHREVGAAVWKRPAVGSPSNCAACHRGAAQGDFNEHDIRIPQ